MNERSEYAWDGLLGTAGGPAFAAGLTSLAKKREVTLDALAQACEVDSEIIQALCGGKARVGVSFLARLARALRSRPIDFLQQTNLLSLEVYAFGLDPLYFVPEGPVRHQARIYMREINPRHQVPEADMTRRNPTIVVLAEDSLLDPLGRLELEIAYLLRVAVQGTGGTL